TLVINETVAGTTQSIPLAGTGTLAPYLSLSTSTLNLGTRMIGRPSTTRSLVVTNSGSAPLQIVSISVTPEFTATHNCPPSLPASSACTVSLVFTPLAPGLRSGTLTIQDNAAGNPHMVSLS